MKKLKEKFLKDSQLVQMTLKEFIDYFQQDLNNSASILNSNRRNNTYYERRA